MSLPTRFPRLLAAFALSLLTTHLHAADAPARITLPFDTHWRFTKGDPALAPSHAIKDSDWRKLDLPHDWSIEGPFDEHAPTGSAGANLPSGIAWYRKTFPFPPQAKGKRVYIEFDAIMANSEVYMNNALLGTRPNGYVPLRYDLTDYLARTGPNILAVRTDTSRQPTCRWYSGAGIYRHTRLIIQNPIHIEHAATTITTSNLTPDQATLDLHTTILNQSNATHECTVQVTLADPAGTVVYQHSTTPAQLSAEPLHPTFSITVPNPQPWDIDTPRLYHATLRVLENTTVLDEESLPVGIRTAEFRAPTGFWLNGKNIKILGVGLHSDMGALGIAVPASAWESRLAALKRLGVNAVRTAHNPPSPEFLDACDRLGLLVMDEFFDAWTVAKLPGDYHLAFKDWWQRDLTDIITRDRNHPSIILYSLGNEIYDILPQNPDPAPDQFTGPMRSINIAKNIFTPMRDLARQLDPTRPVTLAILRPNISGIYDNGFSDLMDVVGQNYRDSELADAHEQNPARKIIGTENYRSRETWLALRDNPALSGQFVWAGADYLGEAGKWPNVVSPAGMLDRTNFPRGDAFERESWWSKQPVLHLVRMKTVPTRPGRPDIVMGLADWTPADAAPHTETVRAYSNFDQVELFLNDHSLGTKLRNADDTPRQWQVPFSPGTLRAVAKGQTSNHDLAATDELHTAAAPAKITLSAERTQLPNDWDDVLTIRATITDAAGITVPSASDLIQFSLTGPAVIAAVDNAALNDHDPFQSSQRHAFQGSCIAILRATADTGQITLTASSPTLPPTSIQIEATPPTSR